MRYNICVLQPTEEASNIIVLPEGEMQSDQPRVSAYLCLVGLLTDKPKHVQKLNW